MALHTQQGSVEFLLDSQFYQRLAAKFDAFLQADPGPDTYLLIGLWRCSPETEIGTGQQGDRTLRQWVNLWGEKGHRVGFCLWKGRSISQGAGSYQDAEAMERLCRGRSNLAVYREPYTAGPYWASSQHQKFFLFSIAGRLEAIVGGFNLHPHYFFAAGHGNPHAAGDPPDHEAAKANGWHDTAVLVRGEAATAVRAEWLRRWRRQGEAGDHFLALINDTVHRPQQGDDRYPVAIATTNDQGTGAQTDIRNELIRRINAIPDDQGAYVYLENYALNDPELVSCLATNIANKDRLTPICVINHPRATNIGGNQTWAYLMYFPFVQMMLPRYHRVQVPGWTRWYAIRREQYDLSLEDPSYYGWFPRPQALRSAAPEFNQQFYRYLTWTKRQGRNDGSYCAMGKFGNLQGAPMFYAPVRMRTKPRYWPYVHSKLALINDRSALIGSANWTYRSLQFDGEMTVIVDHPETVRGIRETLFNHWQNGLTVQNWDQRALPAGAECDDGTAGEVRMQHLCLADFIAPTMGETLSWPWNPLNAAWYLPQVF